MPFGMCMDSCGPNEACIRWGCILAQPGEYDWTVRVRRRCGLFVKSLVCPWVRLALYNASKLVLRMTKSQGRGQCTLASPTPNFGGLVPLSPVICRVVMQPRPCDTHNPYLVIASQTPVGPPRDKIVALWLARFVTPWAERCWVQPSFRQQLWGSFDNL